MTQLRESLFGPLLRELPARFSYQGPGRDYMLLAPLREARAMEPRHFAERRRLAALWRTLADAEEAEPLVPAQASV